MLHSAPDDDFTSLNDQSHRFKGTAGRKVTAPGTVGARSSTKKRETCPGGGSADGLGGRELTLTYVDSFPRAPGFHVVCANTRREGGTGKMSAVIRTTNCYCHPELS